MNEQTTTLDWIMVIFFSILAGLFIVPLVPIVLNFWIEAFGGKQ